MLIQRKVIRGFSTVTMVTKPSHIVTMVYPEFDSRFLLFFHSKCVPLPGNPLISRLPSLSRIVYIVSFPSCQVSLELRNWYEGLHQGVAGVAFLPSGGCIKLVPFVKTVLRQFYGKLRLINDSRIIVSDIFQTELSLTSFRSNTNRPTGYDSWKQSI